MSAPLRPDTFADVSDTSKEADVYAKVSKVSVSTKINVAYYVMRIISHRIDISQISSYARDDWQSYEFTAEERRLALELLNGIQRHEKNDIQHISESAATEYLNYFADKVEELADIELLLAGYDADDAEVILEKLRETDTSARGAGVPDTLRGGPRKPRDSGFEIETSWARPVELAQLWEDVFVGAWEYEFLDTHSAIERWQQFPPSVILHHGLSCCRLAREWLFSMDSSHLNGASPLTGPRWLRQRYNWGPSPWPIHWCEVVRRKTLDSGALAAVAREIFHAREVRSFSVQFIQQFGTDATSEFYNRWASEEGGTASWVTEDLIYQEGCAVIVRGNEMKIWDAVAGWWVNPAQFGGYGAVLALRLLAASETTPASLTWGRHNILPNRWQKIERARGDFE